MILAVTKNKSGSVDHGDTGDDIERFSGEREDNPPAHPAEGEQGTRAESGCGDE
ncbi:hypothetical protein D3C76_1875550 [compost metagenome]